MTEKVFCKDCRHCRLAMFGNEGNCHATKRLDPVCGEVAELVDCRERNANFDCALYEKRPPHLEYNIPVVREPKRAWWRFW